MPPSVATVLTVLLVVALFAWDRRRSGQVSAALLLPVLWMSVTGSRFVTQWLNLGNQGYQAAVTEGSPLDAAYFLALIVAGLFVLMHRRLQIAALMQQNGWLVALMLFSAISVFWSDFPVIAGKRWIKTLGHPIMALIILTDSDPSRAFRVVMRRCAFLLIPFSVLLIKYYPQFGRGFDPWSGSATNIGVGLTKNDLGYICMVFGLFLIWDLMTKADAGARGRVNLDLLVRGLLLAMIAWLLFMANSATSLATLVLGTLVLLALRLPFLNRRYVSTYVVFALVLAALMQLVFDPYSTIVEMLGRNPNLTDRTIVWQDALALQPNALVGAGFESFWLGHRLELMWSKWWWRPTQAHNGFIETYLNLGLIGLTLLAGLMISTLRRIGLSIAVDDQFASLRLAFLVAIVAFNYTEAAFKGVHLVWTIFHLIVIEYRPLTSAAALESPAEVSAGIELRKFSPPGDKGIKRDTPSPRRPGMR